MPHIVLAPFTGFRVREPELANNPNEIQWLRPETLEAILGLDRSLTDEDREAIESILKRLTAQR